MRRRRAALVTGAGRGIGRAAALALARAGFDLALCSRTPSELRQTAKEARLLGRRVFARACDVRRPAQVRAFVREAVSAFGGLDALVNNAGAAAPRGPLAALADRDWERVLQTNLTGAFTMTREFLARGKSWRRAGTVINVSSTLARKDSPGWGAYGPSKAALEALTRQWALEARGTGLRFYALDPGPTRTAMRAGSFPGEDPARLKPPSATGPAFVALAAGRRRLPSGSALALDSSGRLRRA